VKVYVLPPERDLSSTLEDRVKDFAEWLSGEEAKTPSPELFAPQLPSPLGLQDVLKLLTSVNFTLRAQTLRTLSAASHTDDDSDCRAGI
jgi:hypothetical protein